MAWLASIGTALSVIKELIGIGKLLFFYIMKSIKSSDRKKASKRLKQSIAVSTAKVPKGQMKSTQAIDRLFKIKPKKKKKKKAKKKK